MKVEFFKYQGTGNDFVMIDNRQHVFDTNDVKRIAFICDRRFGIGADGLILVENDDKVDFKMIYYNADATQSFCGNGSRCAVAFAKYLGIIDSTATFEAIDGIHKATIKDDVVKLQIQDVKHVEQHKTHVFLDTGSPHHVQLEDNLSTIDIKSEGAKIRYAEPYNKAGSNVNFVTKIANGSFRVRTYERGVEDETLSCGTGVTAVAIAMNYIGETEKNIVELKTQGGTLQVSFVEEENTYRDIWLIGPAKQVFKGTIEC
ncbi:diaminopimelate epimerase [Ichthyenterobacterium magnum]|uniref:Diaminopimelate epimerase n=1 Tax=Ichthyenterobacterium magnum TaxID=1230530 RepID=A0A420DLD3_9FLAO|nr:diaminopimelate epimerase [Ichthyenterobacterium magnum]RKE95052.1 diaminopimelate epimerase [Ichthyenterobacterium magnum]